MTVKDFLAMFVNHSDAGFALFDRKNIYIFRSNEKEELVKQFGNRTVKQFGFVFASTLELDIIIE